MNKNLVISLIGHDRVGFVDELSKLVVDAQGNIEASRMAHLGGEFAILMHVIVSAELSDELKKRVNYLADKGFKAIVTETKQSDPTTYEGWLPYQIEVSGADHEGIVHTISHKIANLGFNIESMDTNVVKAPISGTPLFTLTAIVFAPPDQGHDWYENLKSVADELNVDIEILPYKG
jgi:glycine cleavage system transcriptional repressor